MFEVVTLGSATLDVFLHCRGLLLEKDRQREEICLPYGAKMEVEEILFETGGGGTNTALTFARQNLRTAVLAKIGLDFAGEKILKKLQKERVETRFITQDKRSLTDYSTILWAPDGGRTILVYRGKTRLEVAEIPWEKIQTRWFYISSLEGNLKIVSEAGGRRPEARIAWNPGERELNQREKVLKILPQIEVLILNKEEIKKLLRIKSNKQSIKTILKKAQKLPPRLIIITDGPRGSYFWDGDDWFHSEVYKVSQIETTGAGDAYGSGFISGLLRGFSFPKALKLAAANSASVVSFPGAKKGILRNEEVGLWLKKPLRITRVC